MSKRTRLNNQIVYLSQMERDTVNCAVIFLRIEILKSNKSFHPNTSRRLLMQLLTPFSNLLFGRGYCNKNKVTKPQSDKVLGSQGSCIFQWILKSITLALQNEPSRIKVEDTQISYRYTKILKQYNRFIFPFIRLESVDDVSIQWA